MTIDQETLTETQAKELKRSLEAYGPTQTGKFVQTATFVAGGAFTLSATLLKPGDWHWTIGAAWIFWAACLLSSCGGYLWSASQGMALLRKLESGERRRAELHIERHRWWVSAINYTTFVFLVLGVVFFGGFATQRGMDSAREEATPTVQLNQTVHHVGQVQTPAPTPASAPTSQRADPEGRQATLASDSRSGPGAAAQDPAADANQAE